MHNAFVTGTDMYNICTKLKPNYLCVALVRFDVGEGVGLGREGALHLKP